MQSFTPYRLGTESNWAEVFLAGYQLCLRKTDGSLWTSWIDNPKQKIELEPGFSLQRSPLLARNKWRGMTRIWGGLDYQFGIRNDGTFRIMADQRLNNQSHSYEWKEADLQFGKDTNWLGVAGHYEKVVTLKNDGTLWLWDFHHDYRRGWYPERDEREKLEVKPVRLGTHSDWIAITGAEGGIISLAADGSLWYWPLENASYLAERAAGGFLFGNHDSNFDPLLDISRKPQRLGNIFDKAD
jgi:hypothetical protein